VLICHKGGKYKTTLVNEDYRIRRKRKTEKTECPFAIKAKERPTGLWELCHFQNPSKSTHNHPSFETASGAWQHCRLISSQLETIRTNHDAMISARQTVTLLYRTDANTLVKKRDIYNVTATLRRAHRGGVAPPEALIHQLEAS
jgi:hypothetical protein